MPRSSGRLWLLRMLYCLNTYKAVLRVELLEAFLKASVALTHAAGRRGHGRPVTIGLNERISRSNRAATMLYEATRAITFQTFRTVEFPCCARIRDGTVVGIPRWHASAHGVSSWLRRLSKPQRRHSRLHRLVHHRQDLG
jgi:hypothetical protein